MIPEFGQILKQEVRNVAPSASIRAEFGEIDIYLFDQILRGRFDHRRRVFDAGCGDGRNLLYFLRHGFECHGADADPSAIARVRATAAALAPMLPLDNFKVAELDRLPWPDATMDAVVASAVLHFARDGGHFDRILDELWRVLAPGGLFFARLASTIGLEKEVGAAGRRVRLPDGTERFVVDEEILRQAVRRLGGRQADPIKTTNVEGQRCMTTWCLEKIA
jgi:tellurite methyltransferase